MIKFLDQDTGDENTADDRLIKSEEDKQEKFSFYLKQRTNGKFYIA
jgi:hypothetical protein